MNGDVVLQIFNGPTDHEREPETTETTYMTTEVPGTTEHYIPPNTIPPNTIPPTRTYPTYIPTTYRPYIPTDGQ